MFYFNIFYFNITKKFLLNNFLLFTLISIFIEGLNSQTMFIFAHGLSGNKSQIKWYIMPNKLNWSIIGNKYTSFDFPEVDANGNLDKSNANLAQDADIEALDKVYKACLQDPTVDNIVLVGVSRGASTIINYVSRHPEKLAAIVLESPFDSVEKVIEHQLNKKYIGWVPGLKYLVHRAVQKMYPKYDINGIKPIDIIKSIPKDLPVLFIHSKKDNFISIKSSRRLYKALKLAGNKDSYLLELNDGEHGSYQWGLDANNYQTVVHAFYKKYGIEHNSELAKLGDILLEKCKMYKI